MCVFCMGRIQGSRYRVVVKPLCYKHEGHGLETPLGELIFSTYLIFPAALGSGVYSATNRNEYPKQKNEFLGSGVRTVRWTDKLTAICEPIM
jgi:hypothetical protein